MNTDDGFPDRTRGPASTCAVLSAGFTLLELLVVISIIALLIALVIPSVARARAQSKATHCLARLKDLGQATVTYGDTYAGFLPPAELSPDAHPTTKRYLEDPSDGEYIPYGWSELLYEHVYPNVRVTHRSRYPVQRNRDNLYPDFATCKAARPQANSAGHYRVYVPGWSFGTQQFDEDGRLTWMGTPMKPARLSRLPNHLVLMGDALADSEAGDELPGLECCGECSQSPCYECETPYIGTTLYIDCSPINDANKRYSECGAEYKSNRFSDRHMGATNYLFTDFHAERSRGLRERLGCDANLDGIVDPRTAEAKDWSGCRE
jgi:prepilin-type N-terminal cleavage/methylation domain-containing protein/prepilin-type processing-associated H-X9-DG protein